ncbi:MAG: hypothetical protein FWD60_05930 [Candidatus Azobacteroides sp.]|nr:hypothetical protein [Candidatus Azobacteroides sp.]
MTQISFRKGINSTQLNILLELFNTWNIEADVLESPNDEIYFLPLTKVEKLHSIQLAEEDILAGRLISIEEMKTRHPRS